MTSLRMLIWCLLACCSLVAAELQSGPPLPHRLVKDWAQLPVGWNFGECSGVDVDKEDNVWVFNRGPHKVIRFDKNGKFLGAWEDAPVVASHGLRIDAEGNVWLVDQLGHAVLKCNRSGRVLMVIANPRGQPGNDTARYAFNQPTGLTFTPNGDFYVSDGYVNSRVIKFNKDGEYLTHWGRKGTGDGEFNLVHDVCIDSRGRVYVADRTNARVQIFDADGKFLGKWTDVGAPWGLYYVARENAIYMADGGNNRVVKLNLDGQVLGVLGGFGKTPGKFDFAHNIAVDSSGAIYVVEIKNWRVQKFALK
ncbi:MAG: peptidyl-alpha-hydroxyglycine alpha-amidating lyase family protein [Acidobacteriota bacterium]